MRRIAWRALALAAVLLALLVANTRFARGDHTSTNTLSFAPVAESSSPAASGTGVINFRGGAEPTSRWTVSFEFTGLLPGTPYVVVVQGRFGDDGSSEAAAFTAICSFRADQNGDGVCWHYVTAMRRVGIVQVRIGDERGPAVLQATRAPGGPGSITSVRNAFSPSPAATPQPAASPLAG